MQLWKPIRTITCHWKYVYKVVKCFLCQMSWNVNTSLWLLWLQDVLSSLLSKWILWIPNKIRSHWNFLIFFCPIFCVCQMSWNVSTSLWLVIKCAFKFAFSMNPLEHIEQTNGFSPVCILMWRFRCELDWNGFWHTVHTCLLGTSLQLDSWFKLTGWRRPNELLTAEIF